MKTKLTIDELTDKIMECEKEMDSFNNKELKELEYNISKYASE